MASGWLTDEQFGKAVRRALKVIQSADEGTVPYQSMMTALDLIAQNNFSFSMGFKYDMAQQRGWSLRKEGPKQDLGLDISSAELVCFSNQEEIVLGQHTAEYFLEYQDEIPFDWREYHLVFPGTVWHDTSNLARMPYLYWRPGKDKWYIDFDWLDKTKHFRDMLVRI